MTKYKQKLLALLGYIMSYKQLPLPKSPEQVDAYISETLRVGGFEASTTFKMLAAEALMKWNADKLTISKQQIIRTINRRLAGAAAYDFHAQQGQKLKAENEPKEVSNTAT